MDGGECKCECKCECKVNVNAHDKIVNVHGNAMLPALRNVVLLSISSTSLIPATTSLTSLPVIFRSHPIYLKNRRANILGVTANCNCESNMQSEPAW